jgi:hypothetical protein
MHKLTCVPYHIIFISLHFLSRPTAILVLVRSADALAQAERFKGHFVAIRNEFDTAISVGSFGAVQTLGTLAELEAVRAYLRDVRTWLSPLQFPEEGIKYGEHTDKTGEWFLTSRAFVNWRDGVNQVEEGRSCGVLWCPGDRK